MIRNLVPTRYPKFIKFCFRIPVGTFGLVLGLVGFTTAWFAYSGLGSSVTLIVSVFFIFSAIVWLFVVFAFVFRAFLATEDVTAELRNPNSGVFASYGLMAAMLLGAMVYHMNHMAGQLVVFSFSALTLMFGLWPLGSRGLEPIYDRQSLIELAPDCPPKIHENKSEDKNLREILLQISDY